MRGHTNIKFTSPFSTGLKFDAYKRRYLKLVAQEHEYNVFKIFFNKLCVNYELINYFF